MSAKHTGPYAAIDESFDNATGTDMRLIYGLGVPFLIGVLGIIAFALIGELWLAFVLLAFVIVGGGVVMYGINRMLGDEDGTGAR
jgi:hypothetical protein